MTTLEFELPRNKERNNHETYTALPSLKQEQGIYDLFHKPMYVNQMLLSISPYLVLNSTTLQY